MPFFILYSHHLLVNDMQFYHKRQYIFYFIKRNDLSIHFIAWCSVSCLLKIQNWNDCADTKLNFINFDRKIPVGKDWSLYWPNHFLYNVVICFYRDNFLEALFKYFLLENNTGDSGQDKDPPPQPTKNVFFFLFSLLFPDFAVNMRPIHVLWIYAGRTAKSGKRSEKNLKKNLVGGVSILSTSTCRKQVTSNLYQN